MKTRYAALRGMRDILPEEVEHWRFVERTTREVFGRYGFLEIRTPALESTELFVRSVGQSTDIVHKEMYTLTRGDESICLRPESTAPVVRAFVEHDLYRTVAAGYPVRLFYLGPMFRYERPQKGRRRQFHQIGAEVLGAAEPLADAETLEMLWTLLDALGVGDRQLVLNSLGGPETRSAYRSALVAWLDPHRDEICDDCRRRLEGNPLRVFDCKVENDRRLLESAPSILDHLDDDAARHFEEVRGLLGRFGIPFRVDPRLVRGLDYYERTVFEVVTDRLGAQNAILGGGRYDGLVRDLGGPEVPGFGFAVGIERLLELMDEGRVARKPLDVALVALGEEGWDACVDLVRRLRREGVRASMPLTPRPMGAQVKRADRMGARYALFVGAEELRAGKLGLKDLATGEQIETDEAGVLARLGVGA